MIARVVFLASLVASGLAAPFLTNPTAATTCTGGQSCNITWQADNEKPSLADFGNAKVGLYVGNVNQQTMLQSISDSVNVATTASVQFTVDPNAGENGNYYFIRLDSLTGRNGSAPFLSFSAKFTLSGMSGTFNSTVKGQIAGTTGGGTVASSSSAAAPPTPKSTSSSSPNRTASATGPRASASASASASPNSGDRISISNTIIGAAGAAAALFALAL